MTPQTKTPKKPGRPGRPMGSGDNLTAAIPRTRATPETRDHYFALGGPDWLRRAIERDYAAMVKKELK